jgi:flagellar hook assembly protein FlgD
VPTPSRISLRIYDVSGRLIETIDKGEQAVGVNRAQWNGKTSGKRSASGVYFCRMVVDGVEQPGTRKLLLVR